VNIFDRSPSDWRDLQIMVGQLFSEINCEVEVGKIVSNVRGAKEIDVYVRDQAITPAALYLCECKYWQRAVPQEVVHSFRTVLQDIGAHRGFIISTNGFQSGAFEAAQNTNIDLITFDELQSIFFERWRIAMGASFMPYADRLFPYWDYPGRMPKFKWNASHSERQRRLIDAYKPFIDLGPWDHFQKFQRQLPVTLPAVDDRGYFNGEVRIESYRQFYDFLNANKDTAIHHFQVLHGEVAPDLTRNEYNPADH
jgi:hypothetical protein